MSGTPTLWLTTGLFTLTYAALAVGKVPGLRLDRPGIAFVGAALMLCTGVLTLAQAAGPDSIDYETLFLLFGMMVVVGFLRLSGFFARLTRWSLGRIHSPRGLLAVVVLLSGVLSAFLVNDIVCLALTPLVLHLTRKLGYKPVPHLIGLATAANIGSTGTITGNPQNMFIGAHSHIPYLQFALHLMPVALLGLIVDYFVILLFYRARPRPGRGAGRAWAVEPLTAERPGRQAAGSEAERARPPRPRVPAVQERRSWPWRRWSLFFTGLPIAVVAVGAAAVLMIGRVKPARVYKEVDWSLLLMFVGLFIVVHAFQLHVVSRWGVEQWHLLLAHPVDLLSLASAALSNLVSNVPAVLLFEPVMRAMAPQAAQTAWLALAMSSTFAGNLTILGSVANLIVVENARREGVEVSFWEYCKAGVPGHGADPRPGRRLAQVRPLLTCRAPEDLVAATRRGWRSPAGPRIDISAPAPTVFPVIVHGGGAADGNKIQGPVPDQEFVPPRPAADPRPDPGPQARCSRGWRWGTSTPARRPSGRASPPTSPTPSRRAPTRCGRRPWSWPRTSRTSSSSPAATVTACSRPRGICFPS